MSQIKHTTSFEIDQPAEILFPLFSAEGEKLWVPGWDYVNIMGGTELHEDYIFLTHSHDHATAEAVWVVKRYDPETYHVQFYKVEPGDKVGIIEINCCPLGAVRTRVEVSYEYIALSPTGSHFIAHFTRAHYEQFIAEWERLLTAYFQAGQKPLGP